MQNSFETQQLEIVYFESLNEEQLEGKSGASSHCYSSYNSASHSRCIKKLTIGFQDQVDGLA